MTHLTLRVLSEIIILFVIISFLGLINYKILFLFFLTVVPIFLIYEVFLKPINVKLGQIKVNAINGGKKTLMIKIDHISKNKILNLKKLFFIRK